MLFDRAFVLKRLERLLVSRAGSLDAVLPRGCRRVSLVELREESNERVFGGRFELRVERESKYLATAATEHLGCAHDLVDQVVPRGFGEFLATLHGALGQLALLGCRRSLRLDRVMRRLVCGNRAQQVLSGFLGDEYINDRRIDPGGDCGIGHRLLRRGEAVANPDGNRVASDLGGILPAMCEEGPADLRLALDQLDPL